MQLREWNYELGPSGGFDQVDYPDELIAPFVEFFRKTSLWHNNMDVIEEKVLTLQRKLTEHRNKVSQAAADAERAEAEKKEDAIRAEAEAQALEPQPFVTGVARIMGAEEIEREAALAKQIDGLGHVMVLDESDVAPESVTGEAASKIASVLGAAASLSDEDKKDAGLKPVVRYPTKKVPGLDPSPLG